MDKPKVSIIINNYNYARYLAACISSALSQTYRPMEVIVVDDGSTDNSRECLKDFEDRVSVVLQRNGGQAAAFNSGFARSTGLLVAFLDSDDELKPQAIETVVEHWSHEFSKLQFPLEILDAHGRPTGLHMPRQPVASGSVISRVLETGRYVSSPTSGNVFGRDFLKKVMPIPEVDWAKTADGYLNNCAPFYGSIGAIHEPLAYYRVHGQSMSSVINSSGKLNVKVAEQLVLNGLREKALIEKLASEHHLKAAPNIVVSHWMFLKLKLTLERTSPSTPAKKYFSKGVFKAGFQMIRSALQSPELKPSRKLQYVAWALSVVFLPWRLAQRVIRFAFEAAPQPPVLHSLRRS